MNLFKLIMDFSCCCKKCLDDSEAENLAPAELKKLRNKQRKAKRKAEQESALAAQVLVKREQHHKARQSQEAGDPEAPQLDELVPDKLARAEDPLEQAIKFLTPLGQLAAKKIETHLFAFEIYYRKDKPLLMLQSIKRAWRVESTAPALHECLVRFRRHIELKGELLDPSVLAVIQKESTNIFGGRTALAINTEYASSPHAHSSRAALAVGRALCLLCPERADEALRIATVLHHDDCTLETCTEVLQSMKAGDFGSCDAEMEDYIARCGAKFPYAAVFRTPAQVSAAASTAAESAAPVQETLDESQPEPTKAK